MLIFFFVQALGITTALEVTFSHFRLKASCMHAAVKRHVDRTARTSWLSSSMILSRLQASRTSDCPHRQDLGIAFMDCYDLLPLICISGNNSSQKNNHPIAKKETSLFVMHRLALKHFTKCVRVRRLIRTYAKSSTRKRHTLDVALC